MISANHVNFLLGKISFVLLPIPIQHYFVYIKLQTKIVFVMSFAIILNWLKKHYFYIFYNLYWLVKMEPKSLFSIELSNFIKVESVKMRKDISLYKRHKISFVYMSSSIWNWHRNYVIISSFKRDSILEEH